MTNTRTLKSRNQREGWYCGLKGEVRTRLKGRTLKMFVQVQKVVEIELLRKLVKIALNKL